MSTVGIIVNPVAGKDIRRLVTSASHTSDSAKIGIVRRTVIAAVEAGAERVLVAADPHHLGRRAVDGLDVPVHILDEPVSGSRFDTIAAATRMWKEHVGAVVALGGDGTCRDVAIGWPDVPLIAVSTGTNNVYPSAIDATSAGAAAAFVACGAVDIAQVSRRSKRVSVHVDDDGIEGGVNDDLALVDLALIDTTFVGSRAVLDPATVRVVIASMAPPTGTGLSSIAGRAHPVGRFDDGGVMVRLGAGGRRVRVPLAPGSFTTVEIAEIIPLAFGHSVQLQGPGVLAFDGERDRRISREAVVSVSIEPTGPVLIDVDRTLAAAAADRLFDVHVDSPALDSPALDSPAFDSPAFDSPAFDSPGGPPWPPSS